MTAAERDSISASEGMIVFNTTTSSFNTYKDGKWHPVSGLPPLPGSILQGQSWYKNDIQIESGDTTTPAVVVWNRNRDGSLTNWTKTSGNPSLTFSEENSGYSLHISLHMGFLSNIKKYLLGFVEFSKDNGSTWNLVETTPKIATASTQTQCSFGETISVPNLDQINRIGYFIEKTKLGNKKGDTYLFRLRVVADMVNAAQNKYVINSTGQQNSVTITPNYSTTQSCFQISEIYS